MCCRVLHIVDHWLPETMNWLEALLHSTKLACEHFIHCEYRVSDPDPTFQFVGSSSKLSYPVPRVQKLLQRLRRFQMVRNLNQWLDTHTVDVIHVHFGHMAIRYKQWLIQSGKPIVISLYGFDYEYLIFRDPSVLLHYKEFAKNGARFIVEGNYSKQLLIRYGIPAQQISEVHLLFHRKRTVSFIPWKQPIRCLQVATYTEKKNQLGLLEALEERHVGKFIFSFYGEFYDLPYVKELKRVAHAKQKHAIVLYDKLSFNEYLDKINESHFCIQWSKRSSSNDTEGGCPVFIKDSLGLGRPVLGSKHCDIPDILIHGSNAFLTEEGDRKALTKLLDEIMAINSATYLRLQRNALLSVNENMSNNLSGMELIEIYNHIINYR